MSDVAPGLCETCAHMRCVTTAKGSMFFLCERSKDDPRYAKYPPLPVIRCPGYEVERNRAPRD